MKSFVKKLLTMIAFVFLFAYGVYTLAEQQIELAQIGSEKERYDALCAAEDVKYEKLVEIKENMNTDNYIEEVAREKLGLVMPYEIIFVDANV